MGKTALLVLASFVVMGSYRMASRSATETETTQHVARLEHEVIARTTAMAGYEWAKQALFASFVAISPTTRTFDGQTATVTATPDAAGERSRISSRANAVDGRGRPVNYRIEADIEREAFFPVATAPPAFLRYAILTQGNLSLGGNFSVDTTIWVGSVSGNERNANVHTNGVLSANGSTSVRGFGTYTGGVSVSNPSKFFKPPFNPTRDAVVRQAPAVAVPAFNIPALIAERPGLVDLQVSGTTELRTSPYCTNGVCDFEARGGTATDPFVVYVNGTLNLHGGLVFKGHVVFLVGGTTSINGNIRLGSNGGGTGQLKQHRVAIFTSTLIDIRLNGNAQLFGHLYCGGDIRFNGTADIYGSVTAGGAMTGLGNGKVFYTGIPTSMTQIFQEPEYRLRMVSYSEGWQ